jgi:hypothetical protein
MRREARYDWRVYRRKKKGKEKKVALNIGPWSSSKKDHDAAKNVGMKYQEESSGRNGGNNRHILSHPTAKRKKKSIGPCPKMWSQKSKSSKSQCTSTRS